MFNWVEYNAKIVRRGEILIELDFLKDMSEKPKRMSKRKSGYTKRWLVESSFSSIKRLFGEFLSFCKFFPG